MRALGQTLAVLVLIPFGAVGLADEDARSKRGWDLFLIECLAPLESGSPFSERISAADFALAFKNDRDDFGRFYFDEGTHRLDLSGDAAWCRYTLTSEKGSALFANQFLAHFSRAELEGRYEQSQGPRHDVLYFTSSDHTRENVTISLNLVDSPGAVAHAQRRTRW